MACIILRQTTSGSIIFVLLLLCVPLAAAFDIQSASLSWNGEQVKYIQPGQPRVVDLSFEITGIEDVSTVIIDYHELNPSASPAVMRSTRNLFLDCISNNERAFCSIQDIVMKLGDATATINITGTPEGGDEQSAAHTFTFTIDNTRPSVRFIGPQTCLDDVCYVTPSMNKIYIEMEDTIASFSRMHVAFFYHETTRLVHGCDGLTCWGMVGVPCTDNQEIRMGIATGPFGPSADDAGNFLEGSLTNKALCDASPPSFAMNNDAVTVSLGSGKDPVHPTRSGVWVVSGESVTLRFPVVEKVSPSLTVTMDTAPLGNDGMLPVTGSCADKGVGNWECSLSFQADVSRPLENVRLPVTVKDFVGNSRTDYFVINVLGVDDKAPDDWAVVNPSKQVANKHYLLYSSKRVFIDLSLNRKSTNAVLLDVKPQGTCKAVTVLRGRENISYGTDADLRLKVLSFQGNTILLEGMLSGGSDGRYAVLDKAEYECTIDVQTIRGSYVVMSPENETFRVRFELYESETIGEMVSEEIENAQNKTMATVKIISGVNKALSAASLFCQFGPTMKGVTGAMNTFGVGTHFTSLKPAGDTLSIFAQKTSKAVDEMSWVTAACKALQCDIPYLDDALPDLAKGMDRAGFDIGQMLDPYQSFLGAAMSLCLPAMVGHMDSYNAINCDYYTCLARDIPAGTATLDMCEQRKGYASCTWYSSGLYNSIPFYGLFKDVVGQVVDVVSDPVSLFGAAGITAPCIIAAKLSGDAVGNSLMTKTCGMINDINGAIKAYEGVKRLMTQADRMGILGRGQAGATSCQQVFNYIDRDSYYWDYGAGQRDYLNPADLFVVYDADGNPLPEVQVTRDNYMDQVRQGRTVWSVYTGAMKLVDKVDPVTKKVEKVAMNSYTFGNGEGDMKYYINGEERVSLGVGVITQDMVDNLYNDKYQTFNRLYDQNRNNWLGQVGGVSSTMHSIKPAGQSLPQKPTKQPEPTSPSLPSGLPSEYSNIKTEQELRDTIIKLFMQASQPIVTMDNFVPFPNDPVARAAYNAQQDQQKQEAQAAYDSLTKYQFALSTNDEYKKQMNDFKNQQTEYQTYLVTYDAKVKEYEAKIVDYQTRSSADDAAIAKFHSAIPPDGEDPAFKQIVLDEGLSMDEYELALKNHYDTYRQAVNELTVAGVIDKTQQDTMLGQIDGVQNLLMTGREELLAEKEFFTDTTNGLKSKLDDIVGNNVFVPAGAIEGEQTEEAIQAALAGLIDVKDGSVVIEGEFIDGSDVEEVVGDGKKGFDENAAPVIYAEAHDKLNSEFTTLWKKYEAEKRIHDEVIASSVVARDVAYANYATLSKFEDSRDYVTTDYAADVNLLAGDIADRANKNDKNAPQRRDDLVRIYGDTILSSDRTTIDQDALAAVMNKPLGSNVYVADPRLTKLLVQADNAYDEKIDAERIVSQTVEYIKTSEQGKDLLMVAEAIVDTGIRDLGYPISAEERRDELNDQILLTLTSDDTLVGKFAQEEKKLGDDKQSVIKQSTKSLKELESLLMIQDYIDKNWKGAAMIGSIYSGFKQANYLTNAMANADILKIGWSKDGDAGFDKTVASIDKWVQEGLESASCNAKLGKDKSEASILGSGDGVSLYSSAAFVGGLRQQEGRDKYTYIINAYVLNSYDVEENLTFSVILRGEGVTPVFVPFGDDDEGEPVTTYSLSYKEKKFTSIRGSFLHYPYAPNEVTSTKYDRVCIKFHNSNLKLWFSAIRSGQDEYCAEVSLG